MKLYILIVFTILFNYSEAQRLITTISGQKIVLQNDNSWTYYTENVVPELSKEDSTSNPTPGLSIDTTMKPELENKSFVYDTTSISIPDSTITAIDSFIVPIDTPMVVRHAIANRAYLLEKSLVKEIDKFLLVDQIEKEIALEELSLSQFKINKNKEEETSVKLKLKDLKYKLRTANKLYKNSADEVKMVKKLSPTMDKNFEEKIATLAAKMKITDLPHAIVLSASENNDDKKMANTTIKNKFNQPCQLVKNIKENKNSYIELRDEALFQFTPSKLKNYFKEKELMKTSVALIEKNGQKLLKLIIRILSKDAAKNYGFIDNGNMMKVHFISGKSAIINSIESSTSTTEPYTGNIIMEVRYNIPNEDAHLFQNVALDQVGIMWSSGFEMYDIYEVDVIMNQMDCLKMY